jgi:hypothetical protein
MPLNDDELVDPMLGRIPTRIFNERHAGCLRCQPLTPVPDREPEVGISIRFDRRNPPPGTRYEVITELPVREPPEPER